MFFSFRGGLGGVEVPASLEPVYANFLNCLEGDVLTGVGVLESHGGYITLPEFEPGSRYMPFSSQLDFLGNNIPYWYYVSGNNIAREQVPTIGEMEENLGEFIEGQISNCDFDELYDEGFEISFNEANVEANIQNGKIIVDLDMDLSILKNEDSVVVGKHTIEVNSELKELYDAALEVYEYEQENLFLENYAVDNLRTYAPVDGVELSCSPLVWNAEDVFDGLEEAVEANTLSLRTKGGEFSLVEEENKYFVVDLDVGKNVRFVNDRSWSNAFEVSPSDGPVMITNPIGNQPGLGALGFCYAPYHFVYDIRYPVLVQVYSDATGEIFQFPLAVVLKGNKPREADSRAIAIGVDVPELCSNKNTLTQVNVYDTNLNFVEADISYSCSTTNCEIGKTSNGVLEEGFPQCVNGFVNARAQGYQDTKVSYSVIETGSVDVVMDKLYPTDLDLRLDGEVYDGEAIINFLSEDNSKTVVYPSQREVDLSEGQYTIRVSIYKNSSIELEGTTTEQCVEIPKKGIGGLFGLSDKECFEVNIPEQIISSVLVGGGNQDYYMLESDLIEGIIELDAQSLVEPKTLTDLQNNYAIFETKGIGVDFK